MALLPWQTSATTPTANGWVLTYTSTTPGQAPISVTAPFQSIDPVSGNYITANQNIAAGTVTSINYADPATGAISHFNINTSGVPDGTGFTLTNNSGVFGLNNFTSTTTGPTQVIFSGAVAAPTVAPDGSLIVQTASGTYNYNSATGTINVPGDTVTCTLANGAPCTIDLSNGFAVVNNAGTLSVNSVVTRDGANGLTEENLLGIGNGVLLDATNTQVGTVTTVASNGTGSASIYNYSGPNAPSQFVNYNQSGGVISTNTITTQTTNSNGNTDYLFAGGYGGIEVAADGSGIVGTITPVGTLPSGSTQTTYELVTPSDGSQQSLIELNAAGQVVADAPGSWSTLTNGSLAFTAPDSNGNSSGLIYAADATGQPIGAPIGTVTSSNSTGGITTTNTYTDGSGQIFVELADGSISGTITFPDGTTTQFGNPNNSSAGDVGAAFEIAEIGEKAVDPLVLDLSGTGLSLTNLTAASPYFDIAGTGFAHRTAWIGSGTGFLVSMAASGQIHLFTGTASGGNGFAELAQLDANGDGVINASDLGFSTLYVWQDANGNGQVDPGELESLSQLGIASLTLAYSASTGTINGNLVVGIGSVTMTDGTTRELADVNLQASTTYTQSDVIPAIPAEIAAMPQLHGYGTLMDLHSQMALDPALQGLVRSFSQLASGPATFADLQAATDAIMFRWAAVDEVYAGSRGGILDARRLEFVEATLGQPQTFVNGSYGTISDPGSVPSLIENNAFIDLENGTLARLLVQTSPTIGAEFTYNSATDTVAPTMNLWTSLAELSTAMGPITSQNLAAWSEAAVVLDAFHADFGIKTGPFSEALAASGTQGLDIVDNAISQGLGVSFDASGTLWVSNASSNGILENLGRAPGLTYVYNPGDGTVDIAYSEPAWVRENEGGVGNTLLIGVDANAFTATINASGDEILTDGITGDSLTISNEANIGNGTQYGVQTIQFADGVTWTQPQDDATQGQTSLSSAFTGIFYDTRGYAHTVAAIGGGNTFEFASGYGNVTVTSGAAGALDLSGVGASEVLFQSDAAGDLIVSIKGDAFDSITFDHDLLQSWSVVSRIQSINLDDGTSINLDLPLTFTWFGTSTDTVLAGSNWGANLFYLGAGGDNVTVGNGSQGGSNMNTFVFGRGDGHATVSISAADGKLDLVGVSAADVLLQSDAAGDLTVLIAGDPSDSITFNGDLRQGWGVTSQVQSISLDDGTSINLAQPLTFTWVADATHTTFTGSGWGSNDFVFGEGDGDATVNLSGSTGYLDLLGVTASDVMIKSDTAGDLTVSIRGDAADSITFYGDLHQGWSVSSHLQSIQLDNGTSINLTQPITFSWVGDATHTALVGSNWGANVFYLGAGGDTVTPGTGANGGSNFNTFVGSQGDGNAEIYLGAAWGQLDLVGAAASDVLFQADNAGDLTVLIDGDAADNFTFAHDLFGGWSISSHLESVQLNDGTSINLEQPFTSTWFGTATTTTLTGSNWGANMFYLGAGGDTVYTGNGSLGGSNMNTFVFGQGDGNAVTNLRSSWGALDLVGVTASDVVLQADNAGDLTVLINGDSSDSFTFSNDLFGGWSVTSHLINIQLDNGTSINLEQPFTSTWFGTSANTTLTGSNWTANVFYLGAGGDTIYAGNGSQGGSNMNTFVFGAGDGNANVNLRSALGTLDLVGVAASDVLLQSDAAGDLTVLINGDASDSFTSSNDLFGGWSVSSHLQSIQLDDGTSISLEQPLTFTWIGTSTDTTLVGSNWGANVFYLGAGGDTVTAGNGSLGGSNMNTFVFGQGDGNAVVDLRYAPGQLYLVGVAASDVLFQSDAAGDLTVLIKGDTADSFTFKNDLYAGWTVSSHLEGIQLEDGTSIDLEQPITYTWFGTAADTTLVGSNWGANVFNLGAGGDTVTAGSGSLGASNYNSYVFGRGDGTATVNLHGSTGELDLIGVSASDLYFQTDANNDLIVSFNGDSSDSINLEGDLNGSGSGGILSYINFSDGTSELIGAPTTLTLIGTATNTVLQGSDDHNNVFILGAGSDAVTVGVGSAAPVIAFMLGSLAPTMIAPQAFMNNVIVFGRGDGNATVDMRTGFGELKLQGLNLSDVTFSGTAANLLVSVNGDPNDSISFHNAGAMGIYGGGAISTVMFQNGQTSSISSLLPTQYHSSAV